MMRRGGVVREHLAGVRMTGSCFETGRKPPKGTEKNEQEDGGTFFVFTAVSILSARNRAGLVAGTQNTG